MIRCLSGEQFKSSSQKDKEGYVLDNNLIQGTVGLNSNNFKIKEQSSQQHVITPDIPSRNYRFEDVFDKKLITKPPSQRIQFRLPSGMALRLSGENPIMRGLSKTNENHKQEQDKDQTPLMKDKSIERKKTLSLEEFAGKKFVCIDTSGSKIVSKEEIVDLWGEKECFLQRFKHEEEIVSANFKIFVDQLVSMKTERSGLLNVNEFIELIKKFFSGITTDNHHENLSRPPAYPYRPLRPKVLSAKNDQLSQNFSNYLGSSNEPKESIYQKQFDCTPPKVVRLIRATSAVSKGTSKEEEYGVIRNIEGSNDKFISKSNYLNSAGKPPLKIPGYNHNNLLDETKRNHPYEAWKTTKAQYHPIVTKAFKISMLPHTSKSSTGRLKTEPIQQNFIVKNYEKQPGTQQIFQELTSIGQKDNYNNNSFIRNNNDQGLTDRSDNSFLGESDNYNQQAELECTFQPQEFLIEMENSVLKSFDKNISNNIKNSNSKNKNIPSDIFKDLSYQQINSAKKNGLIESSNNKKVQILGQQQQNKSIISNVKGFENSSEKSQKYFKRYDGQNELQLQFLQNENEAPCWKTKTDVVNNNGITNITTSKTGLNGIFGNIKGDWNMTTRLLRQKEVKVCKNKVSKKGIMLGITKRQIQEQKIAQEGLEQEVAGNQEKSSRITFEAGSCQQDNSMDFGVFKDIQDQLK